MATIVAEALLSASLELLLKKIVSGEFVDIFRSTKLDKSLLEKMETTLLSLQAVLNDAEEKQIANPAVKQWLDKLRDAVFEVEDLFDEINTEALRCKVEAQYESQTVSAKVRNILSSRFKRTYRAINSKLQALFERLEHLQKQNLGLREGVSGSVWQGTPTSSVVNESSICGRDDDRKKLKEYLLSQDASNGGSKIGVVSIVGMGGLGKTTLAKLLYNDPEVKEQFQRKAWAHISKDLDVRRFTKTLLESVTSKKPDVDDLNTLQVQLQQSLRHKKFLLVLDDIWDASYVDWNNLRDIFNSGEIGSKIIITTRDESVARDMQTSFIYRLASLASEDCWYLLAKHAFGENNCSKQSNLEAIGREIAKKCDGLPLAAVALGGLLCKKLSPDHWNHVLKSNIWDLPNVNVQPALLLSYHYLLAPLKQCFSYCSIFPKNSVLEKKMVVQLWIAEGLVHQSKRHKSMEKVGEEYFDELVSRSMIQRHSIDGEKTFEMHDLLNDLATTISSPYYMRLDEQKEHVSLERVRHLSYNRGRHDSHNKFDTLHGANGLRTFLALPLQEHWRNSYLSNKVVGDLLPAMKKLRVLSLSNYYMSITELPKSIGNLIYLQYLNLSKIGIERLPSETCKLYNLQSLLLSGCWKLTELPEDIGKLVNLRHLDISGTDVKEMPIQIAKLQNIQTLSDFVVSKHHDGLKVAELGKFHHLLGKLSISGLQNVSNPSDASQANLKTNGQIDDLELKWDQIGAQQGSEIQSLVLEQLWPSTSLKNLDIKGYGGTSFPNWLGDSAFGNMVSLHISNCGSCSLLPPLGQLHSLKELHIEGMKSVKSVGGEFYGSSNSPSFQPFPSLETLTFDDMPEWEEWKMIGDTATEFPTLRRLSLKKCPKLKEITYCNLPSLIKLELRHCHQLVESGQHLDDNNNVTRRPSSYGFSQLKLFPLSFLQKLTIKDSPSLTSFPKDGLPKTLQSLKIKDCQNLDFLPLESLHKYTSLEDLQIHNSCNPMTSFSLGSLPVLKSLQLDKCNGLKSILIVEDASLQSLSFLTSIYIGDCDELESFPPTGLPIPNLICLRVHSCEKLHSLPKPMTTFPSLDELSLYGLPNLQSFGKEGLPINLRQLSVGKVGEITELGLERLTCLTLLYIQGDDMVNALMRIEGPLLPTSLVTLDISNLHEIECLDGKWLHHLTSLQNLDIYNAPKLKSLPEEGLPCSLSVLHIWKCLNLESLPEMGLPSSLSKLKIWDCPKLKLFPEKGLPSSLSKLKIQDCPELKSLPKMGLPSSLSVLDISKCPLLEESLRLKRGREWHKVAHIPSIVIDRKLIT